MGMTSGDWATWATALSTAGACVAASIAASRAGKLLDIEQARDRQANKIAAWAEGRTSLGHGISTNGMPQYYRPIVACVVANPTDQPIYGVSISWVTLSNEALDETGLPTKELGSSYRALIPPRDTWEMEIPREVQSSLGDDGKLEDLNISESSAIKNAQAVADMIRIGVSFNDSDGKRWLRVVDGRLVRYPKMDYPSIKT